MQAIRCGSVDAGRIRRGSDCDAASAGLESYDLEIMAGASREKMDGGAGNDGGVARRRRSVALHRRLRDRRHLRVVPRLPAERERDRRVARCGTRIATSDSQADRPSPRVWSFTGTSAAGSTARVEEGAPPRAAGVSVPSEGGAAPPGLLLSGLDLGAGRGFTRRRLGVVRRRRCRDRGCGHWRCGHRCCSDRRCGHRRCSHRRCGHRGCGYRCRRRLGRRLCRSGDAGNRLFRLGGGPCVIVCSTCRHHPARRRLHRRKNVGFGLEPVFHRRAVLAAGGLPHRVRELLDASLHTVCHLLERFAHVISPVDRNENATYSDI